MGYAGREHLARRRAGEILALELDPARGERQQAADRLQRRRLAGAVRADERDELAFADLERDVAERRRLAIGDSDALKPEHAPFPARDRRG
jgi:hypothetical protein